MIKLNTSIPLDEWSRFRKLTRTMEASTALRYAITEWSDAHKGNTEPVIMERDPQVADARPGRPSVKPGIKTMIVHFRIEREEWERFLALSVGLLPNQAPLNAVRWLVATRGGDMEALQRQEEASHPKDPIGGTCCHGDDTESGAGMGSAARLLPA